VMSSAVKIQAAYWLVIHYKTEHKSR